MHLYYVIYHFAFLPSYRDILVLASWSPRMLTRENTAFLAKMCQASRLPSLAVIATLKASILSLGKLPRAPGCPTSCPQSHETWGAIVDLIYSIIEPKITDELFCCWCFFPNGTWKGHFIDLKNKSTFLCVPRF